jgi:hypothetical protein
MVVGGCLKVLPSQNKFRFFLIHLMEKHIGGRQMLITLSLWTMPSNEKSKENWNRWRDAVAVGLATPLEPCY